MVGEISARLREAPAAARADPGARPVRSPLDTAARTLAARVHHRVNRMLPTASTAQIDRLRTLPKAEVHAHLEGCFEPTALEQWATQAGVPMPRPRDRLLRFEGLADFLQILDWACGLASTRERSAETGYGFSQRLGLCGRDRQSDPLNSVARSPSRDVRRHRRGLHRCRARRPASGRLVRQPTAHSVVGRCGRTGRLAGGPATSARRGAIRSRLASHTQTSTRV